VSDGSPAPHSEGEEKLIILPSAPTAYLRLAKSRDLKFCVLIEGRSPNQNYAEVGHTGVRIRVT